MPKVLIMAVEKFVSLLAPLMDLELGLSLSPGGSGVLMREVKQLLTFFTHQRIPLALL